MSVSESVPDQDELLTRAVARTRRGRAVVLGILLLSTVIVAVTTVVATDASPSPGQLLAALGPLAVLGVVIAVVYPIIRRRDRNPQLVVGADKATRRAVQKALRTGAAPDPRIDALARDAAARNLRHTWWLWVFGGSVALQLTGMVLRLFDGPLSVKDVALYAVIVISVAVVFGTTVVTRYRSRRYLRQDTPG